MGRRKTRSVILDKAILLESNHSCSICGEYGPLEIHHILPISEGGKDDYQNLIALCRNCHSFAHRNAFPRWLLYLIKTMQNSIQKDITQSEQQKRIELFKTRERIVAKYLSLITDFSEYKNIRIREHSNIIQPPLILARSQIPEKLKDFDFHFNLILKMASFLNEQGIVANLSRGLLVSSYEMAELAFLKALQYHDDKKVLKAGRSIAMYSYCFGNFNRSSNSARLITSMYSPVDYIKDLHNYSLYLLLGGAKKDSELAMKFSKRSIEIIDQDIEDVDKWAISSVGFWFNLISGNEKNARKLLENSYTYLNPLDEFYNCSSLRNSALVDIIYDKNIDSGLEKLDKSITNAKSLGIFRWIDSNTQIINAVKLPQWNELDTKTKISSMLKAKAEWNK